MVASPQIRNQGTIGGNVSQDTRCWYYRGGWPCYRAGGNICYADTPEGRNREHAILHADRCVAVNPSDSAPALIALDAKFVMRTPKGERVVDAEDYFIGPDIDITRLHILQPGDLLTAIRIPSTWAGAQFYFEKVRDRNVWDFPLMNVASAMVLSGGSDRAHPNRGERRRRASLAVEGGRRCGSRQAAERGDRRDGGETGRAGSGSTAVQRLQDPADEKSGEARHRWSRGGNMDFLEWATSPWGQSVPIHIAWFLIWVAVIAGLLFLIVHAIYVRYFAKAKEFASDASPRAVAHDSQARSPAFAGGAAVSLDHGSLHVHAAVYRLPAESRRPVSLGDLSLDRRRRVDRFHPLSHHSCLLLAGFLVDLAGQNRSARTHGEECAGLSECPRHRRENLPSIPWKTSSTTAPSSCAGLSAIVTGVFMMFRVRTIFFPRNPYLFSDMTWGLMYVLHGLAGVGLIALIMMHVYFGLRPEKRAITKSMIFGWMDRDFYLKEHDPKRWVVETASSSSDIRQGRKVEG